MRDGEGSVTGIDVRRDDEEDAPMTDALHTVRPIGVVRSPYSVRDDTPLQSGLNREQHAVVEVDPAYADGLQGLDGFDYAWLLTWLDLDDAPATAPALRQVPSFLQREGREIGLFAMRGPRRINPIGLSLVQVVEVGASSFTFAGVDLLDGTPVLDIKPYVSEFDAPSFEPRCGWFDEVPLPPGATRGSQRRGD
jgi:tRNA-Thr(GGU) m(6)t(6)A37 methyltransferase TsaA